MNNTENKWKISFGSVAFIVAVVTVLSLVPLVFYHRFYFLDDTQRGAIGQWYEVGKLLTQGHLPIFNVAAQGSGNYLAEGQWGTFSPLVWLISLVVYHSSNFLVFSTVFKIVLLNVLGLGVFFLANSMNVQKRWAVVLGFIAPFVGFTMFAGASSWVTDLMVSAFFPWFWWALRRFLNKEASPIWVFVIGYTIITVGYVFGTIMLIMTMLGAFLAAIFAKEWQAFRRVIIMGASLAFATLAVYLPGIAISSVTMRNTEGIFNNNFMSPNVSDLLYSFSPTGYSEINSWWTASSVTYMPLMYISWILLLIVFLDFSKIKEFIKNNRVTLIQWVVPTVLTFALLFGPDSVGPLRFPIRMMAYFGQLLLLLLVMLISQLGLKINKARVWTFVGFVALGIYLELSNTPQRAKTIIVINIVVALLVLLVAYFGNSNTKVNLFKKRLNVKKPIALMLTMAVIASGISLVIQGRMVGRIGDAIQGQYINYHYADYAMPAKKSEILKMAEQFKGNTVIFGFDNQTVMGNDWYITNNNSMNVYTPVGFKTFSEDFRGGDPTRIDVDQYKKLFTVDKTTKLPLADLLQVDTVGVATDSKYYKQIVKLHQVPAGWKLTSFDTHYVIIQRDVTSPEVGSVAWTNQTGIKQIVNTNYEVKLKVPAHSTATSVVFSRTAWPGYSVSGGDAKLSKPLRGYLTRINIPASDQEQTITLSFNPPMLKASTVLIAISVAIALIWTILHAVVKLRKAK